MCRVADTFEILDVKDKYHCFNNCFVFASPSEAEHTMQLSHVCSLVSYGEGDSHSPPICCARPLMVSLGSVCVCVPTGEPFVCHEAMVHIDGARFHSQLP